MHYLLYNKTDNVYCSIIVPPLHYCQYLTDAAMKEWTDCVQSDVRAFGITEDWETMAVKAEVWVEAATKGGRRFMAAWRQEEEDAARHRQEKREATRLGKLQSHTEA